MQFYMKSLRRDLLETLKVARYGNVIVCQRGKLGVAPEHLQCDYYDWCDGKHVGVVWQGEYMTQYSWGEYTTGILNHLFQNKI